MLDRAYVVSSKAAAAAFSDSRRRRLVLELAGREQSLKELAEETGAPLNLLHYHVRRLVALGLIRVAGERARAGRPIKVYRAAAHAFFVPAHLATQKPTHELAAELRRDLDREDARSGEAGVLYFYDQRRGPIMQRIGGEVGKRAGECWRLLKLTDKEARELFGELVAVFARYGGRRERPHAKPYLGYAALAPRGAPPARQRPASGA